MPPLDDDHIREALAGTEWRLEGAAIVRDARFADFAAAMAFVNRVAELAEGANHHPDLLVHGWNRVRLTLSTHTAGAVTAADLDPARAIDALAGSEERRVG